MRKYLKPKQALDGRINPFSTRPPQNAFWYNNSWLGFHKKKLNYVPKEREIFLQ